MKRGEVRWYRFSRPDKTRPVLLLTRDSALDRVGRSREPRALTERDELGGKRLVEVAAGVENVRDRAGVHARRSGRRAAPDPRPYTKPP